MNDTADLFKASGLRPHDRRDDPPPVHARYTRTRTIPLPLPTTAPRQMHRNSVTSFRAGGTLLAGRKALVFNWLRANGAATDRAVSYALGFGVDLNAVRPTITTLIQCGYLCQVDDVTDPLTGRRVRVVAAVAQNDRVAPIEDIEEERVSA